MSTPASRSQTPQNGRRNGADLPTRSLGIANKYYHAVFDNGALARSLRQAGVQVDLPTPAPAKPTPRRPEAPAQQAGAKEARIDAEDGQAGGEEQIDYAWEVYPNYEGLGDAGEEEKQWTLRGKEEVLDKGMESGCRLFDRADCPLTRFSHAVLIAAIEKAKNADQVGVLTGVPRSAFPRIIGSK